MDQQEFYRRVSAELERAQSARLLEALQTYVGQKEVNHSHPLQRPAFYVPGLDSRPWHDPDAFPWVRAFEDRADAIRQELLSLRGVPRSGFQPYDADHPDVHEGTWNMYYFELFGHRWEKHLAQCPETAAALAAIPRLTGTVSFSALTPDTHVKAHCGDMNAKIRCQLGLVGTEGCEIRVGAETRSWQNGKCILFDDSFEHEVWHRGTETRVVLILDVWHPDLTDAEVAIMSRLVHEAPVYVRHLDIQRANDESLPDNSWWS